MNLEIVICEKDMDFCFFAKKMGKIISKNLSGKHIQKLLD